MLELTDSLKALLQETGERLKGHERRRFMAHIVDELGPGGQRLAERELGWNRGLIRKGKREVDSGIVCMDAFALRGRRLSEERLPNLMADIKNLVDSQSQTDPKFKTTRLYTRLSVAEIRRQLRVQYGYSSEELPSEETLRTRLNQLGYYPSKLGKTKPQKKLP
jgi:hypothetical protein